MTLATGTRLGPYEMVAPAGAGGMGEVYRARDTRLDREVAIKVLPSHLSANPDLKARFEREARTISALQHPHICVLHDIGHDAGTGTDFLVMEYLEGETLAERLKRGPLPTEQVLRLGREMADALEKAHRRGIVHRDLKPGNVMLTKSGAKLMDFGLAKASAFGAAASPSGTGAPSFSAAATATSPHSPLTAAGTVVGTFQYMSPEQIEGKEADARSDIFALGAVLYEMLTGKRAFEGKSQLSVASAILEKEPEPLSVVQPLTPPMLEHVVRRCLAKEPDARWQSAGDVAAELAWIAEGGVAAAPAAAAPTADHGKRNLAVLAIVVVAALALGIVWGRGRATEGAQGMIRSAIPEPADIRYTLTGDIAGPPVLSPDGRYLVFAANKGGRQQLWLRRMDSPKLEPLAGSEGASFPFWSPDGRSVAFFTPAKLKRVDLAGGAAVTLCDAPNGRGGSWSTKGTIIFSPDYQAGLYSVAASGGTPTELLKPAAGNSTNRWPHFLPDGEHFLYLGINHDPRVREAAGVYVASLDGKENRLLLRLGSGAQYANGHLLYVREDTLMAQKFDTGSRALEGEPFALLEHVLDDSVVWRGAFSASQNGMLVFLDAGVSIGTEVVLFDRKGTRLATVVERDTVWDMRLSPDGRRLVVNMGDPSDIWVVDLARNVRTKLTFEATDEALPVWSADGEWIYYSPMVDSRRRIHRKRSSGMGTREPVLEGKENAIAVDASRDGKYLLYEAGSLYTGAGASHLWVLPLVGERKPFPLVEGPFSVFAGQFSPDGRWVAYTSTESGRTEVYVTSFPEASGKWQISTAGGRFPRWRANGKELFYESIDGRLMGVEVESRSGNLSIGQPAALFPMNSRSGTVPFDVSPDGQRFVVNTAGDHASEPINLVVNWPKALRD